jgi:integrase
MSIRKRSPRSYQVRVSGFPAQTAPTREAAEKIELDLRRRRALGHLYEAPPVTVGEAIDGLLARLEATRNLSDKSRAYNKQSAKFWEPLRATTLPALRRARVEDVVAERALAHPRSAKNELEFLKRVLHDAKGRGQRVDDAIFEIRPIKHRPRKGRALTVAQLQELASWCPENVSRLILLAGQVGCRQNVWFNLTRDLVDLASGTLTIPAQLAKSRREHRIYLTDLELDLLREQIATLPAGTELVFTTPEGKQWTANRFRDRVWLKAVKAATENDPEKRADGKSAFDGFTFHMLRHTAASLMALAGMDPAVAAERLEHNDGGALFHKTYRHLYEGEKRTQARRLEALVRAEMDKEWTQNDEEPAEGLHSVDSEDGRYWARTSDPQLVELVLSQLS